MLYNTFDELSLSALGFGTMRLPQNADNTIDYAQTEEMVDYAIAHGVNYFDTAFPYHSGESEIVIGKILKKYPRESFYLADKFPGHQIAPTYEPEKIFEKQLNKCQVDYFDFYLLHNVYENSIEVYKDPKWGIIDYFIEQKKQGRIRYLGFSSHGEPENLREFLALYHEHMDFCQIQLNYLDWTLQNAKEKCEILDSYHIPIWVMEPVRGGKLASLTPSDEARLKALRPDASIASWAFRWLQSIPHVTMTLSGMSDITQVQDNIRTYEEAKPLSEEEVNLLYEIAEHIKDAIPCTACRYCCDGCPAGLDIPTLIHLYNDFRVAATIPVAMRLDAVDENKLPHACIGCGACEQVCPQHIGIPSLMTAFAKGLESAPKWADICKERESQLHE